MTYLYHGVSDNDREKPESLLIVASCDQFSNCCVAKKTSLPAQFTANRE